MARIDKTNLPSDPSTWPIYRKKNLTPALEFTADEETAIETKEGEYVLPAGWHGWIAVDSDGDPYPIEGGVFNETYVAV